MALGLQAISGCGASASSPEESGGTGGADAVAGAGAGGSDSVAGTSSHVLTACTNPEPLVPGQETGFVRCKEGYTHRPSVATCESRLPRTDRVLPPNEATDEAATDPYAPDQCTQDADCPGPNGYCEARLLGIPPAPTAMRNLCFTACLTDSDCGAGLICECNDFAGVCVTATCASDADCDEGRACVGTTNFSGCGSTHSYDCNSSKDECLVNADCTDPGRSICTVGADRRTCQIGVVCGRPFLVDLETRRAAARAREDWMLSVAPDTQTCDAELRAALVAHWTDIACMEHASIAAFARFTLELLALGAPADLLEEAQAALADETHHARLCFGLASAYAGEPIGPSTLPIGGALGDLSLENVVRTTLLEGCIGETQAALEALLALEGCDDPAVRAVLSRIAEDETRHAALAWRFVAWAVEQAPELSALVEQAVSAQGAALARAELAVDVSECHAERSRFGVLSARDRARSARDAWAHVMAPCAAALLRVETTAKSVSEHGARASTESKTPSSGRATFDISKRAAPPVGCMA